MMRHSKVVCTIGPASESEDMIYQLALSGMDAARLNFSHSSPEEHHEVLQRVRRVERELKHPIGVIMDLAGPKIRIGDIPGGEVEINQGETITLSSVAGDDVTLVVNYPNIVDEVRTGERIFINDGNVELLVVDKSRDRLSAQVVSGGLITPRKGVNLPDTRLTVPSMTDKDKSDLQFGLDIDVDWVAVSFVRNARDVAEVKGIIQDKKKKTPVLAKIEKAEALRDIDAILEEADGLIIARGDLGVETPLEEVPLVQKRLIDLCNRKGKPVIVATQMLESMVRNRRPTRAEVTDVANAVIDGADAVMLSEETAMGKFPVQTVSTMVRIATNAEQALFSPEREWKVEGYVEESITHAVCHAAYHTARDLNAAAIVTPTSSGTTARMVARYRPKQPIIALSPWEDTLRRLTISCGVVPRQVKFEDSLENKIKTARQEALLAGVGKKGDIIVVTAGPLGGVPKTTNLIQVDII